jgi:hypothetical protein
MSELKACPFCQSDAEIYSAVSRKPYADGSLQGHWVADCTVCDASIEFCTSEEDALNKWNTRTPDTSAKVDVENLVVIDVSDLRKLQDKALEASGYHARNAEYRRKTSGGVLGEAEEILAMQNQAAQQNAAFVIDFILKNGKPLQAPRSDTSAVEDSPARKQAEAYLEGYNDAKREDVEFLGELVEACSGEDYERYFNAKTKAEQWLKNRGE